MLTAGGKFLVGVAAVIVALWGGSSASSYVEKVQLQTQAQHQGQAQNQQQTQITPIRIDVVCQQYSSLIRSAEAGKDISTVLSDISDKPSDKAGLGLLFEGQLKNDMLKAYNNANSPSEKTEVINQYLNKSFERNPNIELKAR